MKKYFKLTDKQRDFIFLNKIEVGSTFRIKGGLNYIQDGNYFAVPHLINEKERQSPFYKIIEINPEDIKLQNKDFENIVITITKFQIAQDSFGIGLLRQFIFYLPFVIYNLFRGGEQ